MNNMNDNDDNSDNSKDNDNDKDKNNRMSQKQVNIRELTDYKLCYVSFFCHLVRFFTLIGLVFQDRVMAIFPWKCIV